jgi:hypothetical protein
MFDRTARFKQFLARTTVSRLGNCGDAEKRDRVSTSGTGTGDV